MLDSKTYYRAKAQWDYYKEYILGLMFKTNELLTEVRKNKVGSNTRARLEHEFFCEVLSLYNVLRVKIHPTTGVSFRNKQEFDHLMLLDEEHPDRGIEHSSAEKYFHDLCSLIDCLGYSRVEDAEESLSLDDFA